MKGGRNAGHHGCFNARLTECYWNTNLNITLLAPENSEKDSYSDIRGLISIRIINVRAIKFTSHILNT